ncbi:MAG: signal peptidase II [Clostridia bacterium]|nr:signal peptidase II [Clostridia bacterium]
MILNVIIPVLVVIFDQLVKRWAATDLQAVGSIPLWEGVFHLTYCENTGAAFSMFTGQRWLLLAVTVVFLAMLLWAQLRGWMQNTFGRMSLNFVIGGAIGNMIDRFFLGYVVDMFDFCLIDFPVFNVADIFLCVGVGMMMLYILVMEPKIEKAKKEAAKDGDHLSDGES